MENKTTKLKAIIHNREKFYGQLIYWYELFCDEKPIHWNEEEPVVNTPVGFLRVPFTDYYEFGGTHEEALRILTKNGYDDIVEGEEI